VAVVVAETRVQALAAAVVEHRFVTQINHQAPRDWSEAIAPAMARITRIG